MITPDSNGLYHPKTDQDVVDLVNYAIANKLQVRVMGAAESAIGSIFTDNATSPTGAFGNNINMELDQIRSVTFDDTTMQATVGAGCNLGFNPYDPSDTSSEKDTNNLFYQLNKHGWAIQNVADAIHQTVGGFISTGSSAGSMQHSFDECIVSITIVDGTGKVQVLNRSSNLNDPFYGVGVSMGLMGIITSVTLQCVAAFNIIGEQNTTPVGQCTYDFFGPGAPNRPSLQNYLTNLEFGRTMWWPYKTLNRAISWSAKTMQASDYNNKTGVPPNFTPQPYQPIFPKTFGTRLPSDAVAATGFELIASWPTWFQDLLGHSSAENTQGQNDAISIFEKVAPYMYPMLIDLYFPCNTIAKPPQQFWDYWFSSLPMDSYEYSNNLFEMTYAELWFPIDQTQNVVNTLNTFYTKNGYAATGSYCVEVYAAKQSPFWMSPGYNQDSFRLKILFFTRGSQPGADETFFNQFWDLFQSSNLNFRPHWGMNLPLPISAEGPSYFQSQFPKWNDFMNLRKQFDPNNIFLTAYWKQQLGIS